MSQIGGNNLGEATVRVTADTKPLQEGLQDAKQKTEEFASSAEQAGEKAEKGFVASAGGATALAASITATAVAAFELGHALSTAIDNWKNGTEDFKAPIVGPIADQMARLRKEIEELQKVATDNGRMSQAKDWLEALTGGLYESDRTDALQRIAEADQKIIDRQTIDRRNKKREADAQRLEDAKKQIEAENIAALEGAERLEAQREKAIKDAQKRYGPDSSDVIDAINRRYDAELRRLEELEARRKQAEDERAAREKQHAEERERREREALERLARQQQEIADKTAAAIASAFSKARTDFASALSMKDLVIGVQALNANLDNMRRNRQQIAAGDIYSG